MDFSEAVHVHSIILVEHEQSFYDISLKEFFNIEFNMSYKIFNLNNYSWWYIMVFIISYIDISYKTCFIKFQNASILNTKWIVEQQSKQTWQHIKHVLGIKYSTKKIYSERKRLHIWNFVDGNFVEKVSLVPNEI